MKLKQIEIYTTEDNEICLEQENVYDDDGGEFIYITPEMVNQICDELQKLKDKITKGGKK